MSQPLRQFLDDLLEGKAIVRSRGELELLRRIASLDELERLEPIAKQFIDSERKQRTPTPATHTDVERILQHPADATVDQLQDILKRAAELKLSSGQVASSRAMLSNMSAERFRGEGKQNVLSDVGWKSTPVGLLAPHAVRGLERLRLIGLSQIDNCTDHALRNCTCHADVREALWQTANAFNKYPEGWFAERLLLELDDHGRLKAHSGIPSPY